MSPTTIAYLPEQYRQDYNNIGSSYRLREELFRVLVPTKPASAAISPSPLTPPSG